MNNLWYKQLGFNNNPFSIKPAIFSDELLGLDKLMDEIAYHILTNKLIFIEGNFGEGKTTMLKRLIKDFGGKKQVIYFSCNRLDSRLDVDRLLTGRYGFLGKLFNKKGKDMILLLDEAQGLTKKDAENLYSHFLGGYFKSIIFVGVEYNKENFTDKVNKEMKLFTLPQLNKEDAVQIIKKRAGDFEMLTGDVVELIFERSGKNVRRMLKNCEMLCRRAYSFGETGVTAKLIEEMLPDVKKKVKKVLKVSKKKISDASQKSEKPDVLIEEIKVKKTKKFVPKKKKEVEEILEEAGIPANSKKKEIKIEIIEEEDDDDDLEDDQEIFNKKQANLEKIAPHAMEEALNRPTEELLSDEQYY
ncbi:MAG: hypothetical protein ABIF40_05025 [archaeon]